MRSHVVRCRPVAASWGEGRLCFRCIVTIAAAGPLSQSVFMLLNNWKTPTHPHVDGVGRTSSPHVNGIGRTSSYRAMRDTAEAAQPSQPWVTRPRRHPQPRMRSPYTPHPHLPASSIVSRRLLSLGMYMPGASAERMKTAWAGKGS